jgi:hypothetical protein
MPQPLWCIPCLRAMETLPVLGPEPAPGRELAVAVCDGESLCAEHLAQTLLGLIDGEVGEDVEDDDGG